MVNVWRPLALALAGHLALGAAAAWAQTVIVRNVGPGSPVNVVLNTGVAAQGTAGADGVATLVVARTGPDRAIDARIWVDTCGETRRVVLAEPGVQPPLDPVCRRTPIEGLYLVQGITTLLIDVDETPRLRIRQGRAPAEWFRDPAQLAAAARQDPMTGLILFGGAGLASARDFGDQACGTVSGCSRDDSFMPLTAGLGWWFAGFAGVEARYQRLGEVTAEGAGSTFRFDSEREGGLLAFSARAGVPIGRVRPYGRGGLNYHRATFTTTQTVEDTLVTVDGATQVVPGGTQTFQVRTGGWGLIFGGGIEIWFTRGIGLFAEGERAALKGKDLAGGEARMDDATTSLLVGLTFRFP